MDWENVNAMWLSRGGFTWIRKKERKKKTNWDFHFNQMKKGQLSTCISGNTYTWLQRTAVKEYSWELDIKLWEMWMRSQAPYVMCVAILHYYLMKVSLGISSQIQFLLVFHTVLSSHVWEGDWTESQSCVCVFSLPQKPLHSGVILSYLALWLQQSWSFPFISAQLSHIPT